MLWVMLLLLALPLLAQPACPSTPAWSPCDLVFDLEAGEKPDAVELRAEFRSPRHRTYLMHAFRAADRRFVIRFSPTEGGTWDYRLTSSIARFDGKQGQFNASDSESPGSSWLLTSIIFEPRTTSRICGWRRASKTFLPCLARN